ncbi:hypothetical protein TeGR_g7413 [Tetraparma gracilis]|uniref:Uracil-DNA glycosylase n=1 Tax=Tetraparma gracilis TaxID=2962635 RepID=A0ABQ6MWI1_9STRA|nr:hypothetical protein TeGR_g7413 [Tetraparma gracilis]
MSRQAGLSAFFSASSKASKAAKKSSSAKAAAPKPSQAPPAPKSPSKPSSKPSAPAGAPAGSAATTSSSATTTSSATTSSSAPPAPPGAAPLLLSGLSDPGWLSVLSPPASKKQSVRLAEFLSAERARKAVHPPAARVFEAFNLCPLPAVRVVIVGQDPYHGAGQGHGLSFSVLPGVATPPSLRNVYKELLATGAISSKPGHGHLESWARQGVFLLNAVLTVRQGEANSHQKKGWEEITKAAVNHLSKNCSGLVFLCWGKPALKMCESVSAAKHAVIQTSHPSPLGATKTDKPFIGSDCFNRCNEKLRERGLEPIDWDSVNK